MPACQHPGVSIGGDRDAHSAQPERGQPSHWHHTHHNSSFPPMLKANLWLGSLWERKQTYISFKISTTPCLGGQGYRLLLKTGQQSFTTLYPGLANKPTEELRRGWLPEGPATDVGSVIYTGPEVLRETGTLKMSQTLLSCLSWQL